MRTVTLGIILSVLSFTTAYGQEASDWRAVAHGIPLGSRVRIERLDGARVSGTLMRADANSVTVKKNTRRPEPAVTIPFEQVGKIERAKEGGFSIGKAIAVGAGAGAGAMLTLILFAMQLD
ncbi:MAG TPA: hypothetical protein VEC39_19015 [Vicinamibacterales bacterium]|nr:hypothetical protein [Vicinamibacterales bacterium]